MIAGTASEDGYSPAKANVVQPRTKTSARAPTSGGGPLCGALRLVLTVVALVLIAVITRVVVLVAVEVDAVQHAGQRARTAAAQRLERALGVYAARHLRADDEDHTRDFRRQDDGV